MKQRPWDATDKFLTVGLTTRDATDTHEADSLGRNWDVSDFYTTATSGRSTKGLSYAAAATGCSITVLRLTPQLN